jgi:hypothetical protein
VEAGAGGDFMSAMLTYLRNLRYNPRVLCDIKFLGESQS